MDIIFDFNVGDNMGLRGVMDKNFIFVVCNEMMRMFKGKNFMIN